MSCCRSNKHELVNFVPTQEYHAIRRECLREDRLFEDDLFPADNSVLSSGRTRSRRVKWLRPHEIVELRGEGKAPMMEVPPRDRFDINQGDLGNCWFLAALSNLAESNVLFNNVVPKHQNFKKESGYAGIFRFRFFRLGKWVEVVIDDRLPTCDGRLIFMRAADSNEFWSPLLEKAYAKLYGGYEGLDGGNSAEAAVDFTGGLSESLDLTPMSTDEKKHQFYVLQEASFNKAFMSCSLRRDVHNNEQETGLQSGHAYTITGLVDVGDTLLIRLRNPWGSQEWKGAWSDNDEDNWDSTTGCCFCPRTFRSVVGLDQRSDGEFYMNYEDDFLRYFGELEIVWLTPKYMEKEQQRKHFKVFEFHNKWEGETAGGIVNQNNVVKWNYLAKNPKFMFSLSNSNPDKRSPVIVSLSQKGEQTRRLQIGFRIYECEEGQEIDEEFLTYNREVAKSGTFIDSREIIKRCSLTSGTFCVIPSTFRPGINGEFLLRIFVEKKWGYLPEQTHQAEEISVRNLFGCFRRKVLYRRRGCCGGGCLPSCFGGGCCGGECWQGCYRGGWLPNCR